MKLRTVLIALAGSVVVVLLNATLRYAEVEVTDVDVTIRLGPLGYARLPRNLVVAVRRVPWRWYYGYGIRLYGPQAAGFVGRPGTVVEFVLSEPVTIRAAVPFSAKRVAVVVEDPEGLLARFGERAA